MRAAVPITVLTALLLSDLSLAQPLPSSYHLEYTRGSGADACPDEQTFRTMIAANLDGTDPFTDKGTQRLTVQLSRTGQRFDGQIKIFDAAGNSRGERAHDAPSCSTLARQLVTSICLILPPPARPATPRNSPAAAPPRLVPAANEPSPPHDVDPPAETAAGAPGAHPLTADTATPKQARPASNPGPRPQVAAGFHVPIGSAPSVTAGFNASFGLRWPMASLNVEGRADLPSSTVEQPDRGRASASLLGGALIPCFHLSVFMACGVVAGSAIHVRAATGASDAWGPRVDLGARVGLQLPIYGPLSLQLSGDLLAAVVRNGIIVDRETTWVPPVVNGLSALRVVAAF